MPFYVLTIIPSKQVNRSISGMGDLNRILIVLFPFIQTLQKKHKFMKILNIFKNNKLKLSHFIREFFTPFFVLCPTTY